LSKSITTKKRIAPFRDSMARISWAATLSSTKLARRARVVVRAVDADEAALAVVEAEDARVVVAEGAEAAVVAGTAETVGAVAEIAAGSPKLKIKSK
jgi:hypothetical protein